MENFGKAKEEWFRTFLTLKNDIPSHAADNLATKKRGIQGKQLNANGDHAYLLRLLGGPF